MRDNPLTRPLKLLDRDGPKVSERTWHVLRRYGLSAEVYSELPQMR